MKVIDELLELAKEHHQSLVLANKCIKADRSGFGDEHLQLCHDVARNFRADYSRHFQLEEQWIFTPLIEQNTAMRDIASGLQEEHVVLLDMAGRLESEHHLLGEFGALLKSHTRTEDRELFPRLQGILSPQQLRAIKQNTVH